MGSELSVSVLAPGVESIEDAIAASPVVVERPTVRRRKPCSDGAAFRGRRLADGTLTIYSETRAATCRRWRWPVR